MLAFLLMLCVLAALLWWFLPNLPDGMDDRLSRWLCRVPKVFTQPHLLPPGLASGSGTEPDANGGDVRRADTTRTSPNGNVGVVSARRSTSMADGAAQARESDIVEGRDAQSDRTKRLDEADTTGDEQGERPDSTADSEQARRAKEAEAAEQTRRAKEAEAAEQTRRAKEAEAAEQTRRAKEAEAAEQARRAKETEAAERESRDGKRDEHSADGDAPSDRSTEVVEGRGGVQDAGETATPPSSDDARSDDRAASKGGVQPLFDAPEARDDLKKISGVGRVMEKLLNELGVVSFAQLAAFDQADIDRVDAALKDFPGRVERDDWVGQARRLAGSPEPSARAPQRSSVAGGESSATGDGRSSDTASDRDDLTRISGIGRATRERLGELGVTTFAAVAGLDEAAIERIEQALDDAPGRVERDGWVAQAKSLLDG